MKTKKTTAPKAKKAAAPKKKAAPVKKAAAPAKKAAPVKKVAAPVKKAAPAKKVVAPVKKAAAPAAPKAPATFAEQIALILDKDKAQSIVIIPLKGKTAIADAMIIATGTSSRHVVALAQNLRDKIKATYKINAVVEGTQVGDWAIVDAGDVIVHVFREEARRTYNLEKLWGADFSTVHYTLYQ